jgi:hypothetical protein
MYLDFYISFFILIVIMSEKDRIPNLSPSSSTAIEASSTSAGYLSFRWWRFWPECFYSFSAACSDLTIGEVTLIEIRIEVCICQFRANGEPAWSDGAITAAEMQSETYDCHQESGTKKNKA